MSEERKAPGTGWIDVSVPLRSGMVHWPGSPEVDIRRISRLEDGDRNNVTHLSMVAHTGTHVDAPNHFVPGARGVDELPLELCMGPARVLEVEDRDSVKPGLLEQHRVEAGERILFKTENSHRCWSRDGFVEDFVYLSTEAGRDLADRGVQLVGVDYLSVGGYGRNEGPIHRALLEAGVWIIEGLNLSGVKPGAYDLVCLPVKIEGADGAPARVLLRPRSA